MSMNKKFDKLLKSCPIIFFDNNDKFVLMSDCHRGNGNHSDTFMKNRHLFLYALDYYYKNGFSYIELGDGDELWGNKSFDQILEVHGEIFYLMSRFLKENRLYMLYGNHDMQKKDPCIKKKKCRYYDYRQKKELTLLPNMQYLQAALLLHKESLKSLFLIHGHQADFLNDTLWRVSRFLVRYIWKPLENIGFLDPTSAAKNYKQQQKIEKKISQWATKRQQLVVAGHTHRPSLPVPKSSYYFNDGSCVHPGSITGIEIENGGISLIKWTVMTKKEGNMYVGREVLDGPYKLAQY